MTPSHSVATSRALNNNNLIKAPFLAPSSAKIQSTMCATCNFSCLGAFLHISIVLLSCPPSFAFSDLCQRIPRHSSKKDWPAFFHRALSRIFLSMSVSCFSTFWNGSSPVTHDLGDQQRFHESSYLLLQSFGTKSSFQSCNLRMEKSNSKFCIKTCTAK